MRVQYWITWFGHVKPVFVDVERVELHQVRTTGKYQLWFYNGDIHTVTIREGSITVNGCHMNFSQRRALLTYNMIKTFYETNRNVRS